MQKGFSSVLILVISALMLLVLGAGIWYYFEFRSSQNDEATTEAPVPTSPTSTPSPAINIPQGWIQYSTPSSNLTFYYPQDAEVTENIEGINVTILGPTQTEGTELHDGLSLNLSTSPLNGRTLEEVATERRQESANEPVVENVTEVEQIQYANKQGYSYTVSSLGTRDVMFFPLSNDLYLQVINGTVDPTNAGFHETAEQIVSTIKEVN